MCPFVLLVTDPRSRYVDVLGQEWKNSPVTKCAAVPNCPAQRPAVQSGPAAEPFIVRAKTSGEGWLGFCRKKGALLPEDSSKSVRNLLFISCPETLVD